MTTITRNGALLLLVSALALSGCAALNDGLLPIVPGGDPADDLLPIDPNRGDDLLPINPGGEDDLLPVTVDPEPNTPACLRGVWLLDNASYRALIQPLTQSRGGTIRSVTGQVVLTFGDGDAFESLYDGWKIITDTSEGSATIERNGVDSGIVRYATGSFTFVEQQAGSSTQGFVETPRGNFPLPELGTAADPIVETAGYQCAGDFLTVTIPEGDLSFRRL